MSSNQDSDAPKEEPGASVNEYFTQPSPLANVVIANTSAPDSPSQKVAIDEVEKRGDGKGGDEKATSLWDVGRRRRFLGYGLGAIAVTAAFLVFNSSLSGLDTITPNSDKSYLIFDVAKLAAHAVITVAILYFCYQLLKASERMFLPHWWLKEHRRTVGIMLGVKDPMQYFLRHVARAHKISKVLSQEEQAKKT